MSKNKKQAPPKPCVTLDAFLSRWASWGGPKELIATLDLPGDCPEVRVTRALILLDWRVRTANPIWYRLMPELAQHAEILEGLRPLWTREERATVTAADADATCAAADADATAATCADADATDADAADAAADAADAEFLRRFRERGGYWYYGGWRAARCYALQHAEKRDGTPGLRTREQFDALLAPVVAILHTSAVEMYWRAVAGPVVVRAAIQCGDAAQFVESLGPLMARPGLVSRHDRIRLAEAIATDSREVITFDDETPIEAA